MIQSNGKREDTLAEKQKKVILSTKRIMKWGSFNEVGDYAIDVRLLMYEAIVIPIILSNTETWGAITKSDEEKLEKMQKDALLEILHLKRSTSYWGVLM